VAAPCLHTCLGWTTKRIAAHLHFRVIYVGTRIKAIRIAAHLHFRVIYVGTRIKAIHTPHTQAFGRFTDRLQRCPPWSRQSHILSIWKAKSRDTSTPGGRAVALIPFGKRRRPHGANTWHVDHPSYHAAHWGPRVDWLAAAIALLSFFALWSLQNNCRRSRSFSPLS
jgi:hypothetical protein